MADFNIPRIDVIVQSQASSWVEDPNLVYIEYVAMEFKALGTKFPTWEGKLWQNISTILKKGT